MTYIVWTDNGSDGWTRSEDLESLEDVLGAITKDIYGSPYVITKKVDVQLIETPRAAKAYPGGPLMPGIHAGGTARAGTYDEVRAQTADRWLDR